MKRTEVTVLQCLCPRPQVSKARVRNDSVVRMIPRQLGLTEASCSVALPPFSPSLHASALSLSTCPRPYLLPPMPPTPTLVFEIRPQYVAKTGLKLANLLPQLPGNVGRTGVCRDAQLYTHGFSQTESTLPASGEEMHRFPGSHTPRAQEWFGP